MNQQLKNELRTLYSRIKKKELLLNGNNYHYRLHQNALKIVTTLNQQRKIKIIGSYMPLLNKEIIPPFIDTFQYAYPRFKQAQKHQCPPLMDFKLHRPKARYTDSAYGIKLPPIEEETITPDMVFVPLNCFNPLSKHRIGFGKGYYDLFIRTARQQRPNIIFIGIGLQILKQEKTIFWDQNDQNLDYVITEKQIY